MSNELKAILIGIFAVVMVVGAFLAPERGKAVWTRRDWIGGGVYFFGILGFVSFAVFIP